MTRTLFLLPMLLACVRTVDLGERADGGPDVPLTDAPLTDAPVMDSPPSVCAACGGPASAACLYAPGCGATQRVCAANTCGDAVAIAYCGCDGRTFLSGCLTPDRPFRARGPCEDGATTPDVPDAALPFCPEEVDPGNAQNPDLRYRRAAFALPPDRPGAAPDAGATVAFDGTWVGTRMLAGNIVLGCPAGDVRYACRAETVIQVMNGAALFELVVGFSATELAALTPGTPVSVRARTSQWDGATPRGYDAELIVRRRSDNALMLAAVTGSGDYAGFEVPVSLDAALCTSRPEPICNRTLRAYALRFGTPGAAVEIPPDITAVLPWYQGATFWVRNRVAWRRITGPGMECADVVGPVTSFEIVRQPGT
ncbi:MAG: hypothetical protein U0325_08085 [Polyangiales bacterium]